ncbi:MAG: diguanylate cyclase [Defluviitaleaceae bacterium]|nr:diguanylate cyclase [Defluviitaleaceae bacterium]
MAEQRSILIVDDTPMQLKTLSKMLSSQYDVILAQGGEEGLKLAYENNIDLMLLDLNMPDLSGFEVLSHLKASEKTKDIPVIFITGSESYEDELEALLLGAIDFIRKPFVNAIVNLRVELHMRLIEQMRIIERHSLIDGLTGANNRRCFDKVIEREWRRALREKEWISMLFIDIDKFKVFNDTYGHLNGDACLKAVVDTMQHVVKRGGDHVFRWGGEEFAVLLPNTAIEGAIIVAEELRKAIAETPIKCDDKNTYVTVSVGVGTIIPDNRDYIKGVEVFCTKLDKALYRAKENGRNRVEQIIK